VTSTRAVLFDFDGTLADTAPDLAAAVNLMRTARGLRPLEPRVVRPYASMGARGLLRIGFDMSPEDAGYIAMRDEFLDNYARSICVHTRLFDGMAALIDELAARRVAWGIVTNKATRFTSRLLAELGVTPACVVCGDTTAHLKPHPAPLLAAAEKLELAPADCIYVGDDLRDIQAARAAGMRCIAVQYGYHGTDNPGPASWNADAIIEQPLKLLEHL
jgi:N-acetyl-D-muramate 6-phosphate phosphatase